MRSELLPDPLRRAVDLAKEKGSSTWLTAPPLIEHGFTLHKGAFQDALALRYGWTPSEMPPKCACGSKISVEHALSCAKGGFPSIRHNEIRNLTATLLTEVCHNVCIEPGLQSVPSDILTGATANHQDGARLDIAANGLKERSSMSECSTPMPHQTDTLHSHPATGSMSRRRNGCMNKDAEKWNTLLYPSSDLRHGRSCQRGHNILQKIGLFACLKMGSSLQQHIVLAAQSSGLLPVTLHNPVHQRSPIITRSCHQDPLCS